MLKLSINVYQGNIQPRPQGGGVEGKAISALPQSNSNGVFKSDLLLLLTSSMLPYSRGLLQFSRESLFRT